MSTYHTSSSEVSRGWGLGCSVPRNPSLQAARDTSIVRTTGCVWYHAIILKKSPSRFISASKLFRGLGVGADEKPKRKFMESEAGDGSIRVCVEFCLVMWVCVHLLATRGFNHTPQARLLIRTYETKKKEKKKQGKTKTIVLYTIKY